jgi:hypothetical protein
MKSDIFLHITYVRTAYIIDLDRARHPPSHSTTKITATLLFAVPLVLSSDYGSKNTVCILGIVSLLPSQFPFRFRS